MRMDKMTSKFQLALADAQSLAVGRDHQFIEPAHLMIALLDQEGGTVRHLLAKADVNVNLFRSQLGELLDQLPQVQGAAGEVHVSNDLGRLLNITDKLAQQRKDSYISSELFILAALEDKGRVGELLRKTGATQSLVEQAIDNLRGGQQVDDPNAEDQRQALEKYTIDLTERAEQGKLDPVIGRDDEIRRTIQVLQRRTKNNPVLIGEPGVGKTAIAEGLAQRIIAGNVPELLRNKRVVTLDLSAVVAGTKYRGEFEERLKAVMNELRNSSHHIILVIDEIHTLAGSKRGVHLSLSLERMQRLAEHEVAGRVRIGVMDDYGTIVLPSLLKSFAVSYPGVEIHMETGLTSSMPERVGSDFDIVIAMHPPKEKSGTLLCREAAVWAGSAQFNVDDDNPLPVALYPSGCLFRKWALESLDRCGRAWRLAFVSHSLSAVEAIAARGLAVTVVKQGMLPASLTVFGRDQGLPRLPRAEVRLHTAPSLSPAAGLLASHLRDHWNTPRP